jgi:hypothetical protein
VHSGGAWLAFRILVCRCGVEARECATSQPEVNAMNAHIRAADLGSTLIEVDATPLALTLPAGAALFALRGEVWLTQEGSIEDLFLVPGQRFDVRSRAPIVVSATGQPAELYVAQPADAGAVETADLHDFLRASALRLRRDEIDRLTASVAQRVTSLGARVLARLRSAATGRPSHNAAA